MLSHLSMPLNSHSQQLQTVSVAWETLLHPREHQLPPFCTPSRSLLPTATRLSTRHSGERQKVPLPIPPTTWGTVEQHHCVHVRHRIPTECHPGTQALSFSERCPMVQAKTSWKIQDEYHSLYLRNKRFLVLNYYRELRFFRRMKTWYEFA